MESFTNKRVLVTGAASGIGRACAELLAARGARLALLDRDGARLAAVARDLGGRAHVVDLAESAAVGPAIAAAVSGLDGLDAAINAAGIEGPLGAVPDLADDAFDVLHAVNVRGLFLCLKAEIAAMTSGAIVNLGSIYGLNGQPRFALYGATKHAVAGLTKAAALEVAARGIRINAVAPGPIATPLLDRATGGNPTRVVGNIPMRRLGRPDEVARAALWLASDESSFVTGHILSVDGGMIAQAANTPDAA